VLGENRVLVWVREVTFGFLSCRAGLTGRGYGLQVAHRMPFPIRALQVDGGSEFAAEFELACQHCGLRLFVLPPRSPKLNGSVERAQRTHTEEFYQVPRCSLEMKKLNLELRQWEGIYNLVSYCPTSLCV
jgi:putative transposase